MSGASPDTSRDVDPIRATQQNVVQFRRKPGMDRRAERIRELRTLAGLTQFDVANKTRIERSRLSLVENGHVRLTEDEYAAIERVIRPVARRRVARSRLFRSKGVLA
jgi:DNA-binding XRE family transcriptional regulator